MRDDTYVVWRRNDGYVAATTYTPGTFGIRGEVTFEVLLVTTDWLEARAEIVRQRELDPSCALPASLRRAGEGS